MQFATTSNSSPVTAGKFKIAVAQESPQSIREFTKQIQVRDQTECKETFKAIKNATTDAEKNAILAASSRGVHILLHPSQFQEQKLDTCPWCGKP